MSSLESTQNLAFLSGYGTAKHIANCASAKFFNSEKISISDALQTRDVYSTILCKPLPLGLLQCIIQLVLLFEAEVWTQTKQSQKKLVVFENKILRRIFGPIREIGE